MCFLFPNLDVSWWYFWHNDIMLCWFKPYQLFAMRASEFSLPFADLLRTCNISLQIQHTSTINKMLEDEKYKMKNVGYNHVWYAFFLLFYVYCAYCSTLQANGEWPMVVQCLEEGIVKAQAPHHEKKTISLKTTDISAFWSRWQNWHLKTWGN